MWLIRNLFEALIEIFRHIYEYDNEKADPGFEYAVKYEIDDKETEVIWKAGKFSINGKTRATIGKTPLPDNVLIYYSGHNDTVAELVQRYEDGFRKRIKGANPDESRRFIGIGAEYKQLLLAVLLMQPGDSKARQFICQKLGVSNVGADMYLTLQRPSFATGALKALEVDSIESFDPRTHYWGADGITRDFLEKLVTCIKGEFNHGRFGMRPIQSRKLNPAPTIALSICFGEPKAWPTGSAPMRRLAWSSSEATSTR